MDYLSLNPVPIVVTGRCNSAAVVIAAAGKPGARFATRNAQFFLHPATYSELEGNRKQIALERGQLARFDRVYVEFLAQHTKRPAKFWREAMEKETYLSAEQALEAGLIDRIA